MQLLTSEMSQGIVSFQRGTALRTVNGNTVLARNFLYFCIAHTMTIRGIYSLSFFHFLFETENLF